MNKTFDVKLWDEIHTLTVVESALAALAAYVNDDTCPISVSITPKSGVAACMIKPVALTAKGMKQP